MVNRLKVARVTTELQTASRMKPEEECRIADEDIETARLKAKEEARIGRGLH